MALKIPDRLFARYYKRVRKVIRARMGPRVRRACDSDDVLQRTFHIAVLKFDDFEMRNEEGSLSQPMSYRGVLPDLFRDGQNVTAAGRLDEGGVFQADEIMTKCPSKYEGVEAHPEQVPSGSHQAPPGSAGPTPVPPSPTASSPSANEEATGL